MAMSLRIIGGLALAGLLAITGPAVAESKPAGFHIGFAQDNLANDWRLAQAKALQAALAPYPDVRFTITDARGSTARQVMDVEDLVAAGVDVLITSPQDGRAMTPVIGAAYRSGTPVVLLTRLITSDDYTSFITPDDADIARRAARLIAERLGGRGRVVVLQGVPTATTAIVRTQTFLEELERHPGVEVVGMEAANYLRADALRAMEKFIESGIGFDAIYAQSDSMAAGARMALKHAGIDPGSLVIVGIDYIGEAREAIRRGEQTASFTYPLCAKQGAEIAVRILRGEPVPKRVLIESTLVTRDNVEAVEPIFPATIR